jgi:aspartyl-tRNA(Asn)/glutamyl-tRNA(Gln) amidotransferase subunit A
MMESAAELAAAVRTGARSAVAVVEECLELIEERNGAINAFACVAPDLARCAARAVDAVVARGEDPGPLAGVPFGVKDLEDCAGMPTRYGSLAFRDNPPALTDSLHVARLRAAGAVPVGKTTTPELGTLPYTSTEGWGVTRNPWDLSRSPGGSSGGSAAAVAAGMVTFATSTDGGGSTRIPAAWSGLVGHRPSYGRIPNLGPSPSQTIVAGVHTTTVADSARCLDVAAGPDNRDRASLPVPGIVYEEAIESFDVEGLRARWSPDLGFAGVDPEVAAVTRAATESLAEAADLDLDTTPVNIADPVRAYLRCTAPDLWMLVEAGSWPAIKDLLGAEVGDILSRTEHATVRQLIQALRSRAEVEKTTATVFDDVDVLITPTVAVPPIPAEGPVPDRIDGQAVPALMALRFTMPASLCWNPACSVPAGFTSDGLPVGLQIVGRRHHDHVVLRLARILERARPWPRWATATDDPV